MSPSTRRVAGRYWLLGFKGPAPADDFLRLLERFAPPAVIVFRDNLPGGPGALPALRARLEEAAQRRLRVVLDEEGGWIQQLHGEDGPPPWPSPRAQAMAGPDAVRRCHRAMAASSRALGAELLATPLADLDAGAANPVIGTRSFGDAPDLAGACVAAAVTGLGEGGAAAVLKHYPGHGDSLEDSHLTLPAVPRDRARSLEPFREGIAAGAAAIMSAHLRLAGDDDARPATYRPDLMRDRLAGELGFGGLVVTDALEMAGAAVLPLDERGSAALAAGCHLLTLARWEPGAERMLEALATALDAGRLRQAWLDEADARWAALEAALPAAAAAASPVDLAPLRAAGVFRPGGGEATPLLKPGASPAIDLDHGNLGSWRLDEYLEALRPFRVRRLGEDDAPTAPVYLHLGRTPPPRTRLDALAALEARGEAPAVLANGIWGWTLIVERRLATAESSPAGLAALLAAAGLADPS